MSFISTKENPNGDIIVNAKDSVFGVSDVGGYTGLHQHSVYSALDGYGKLEEYIVRAKALGMKGLCLSEHGNMMGHIKQTEICKKNGIKPIYANEGYFTLQSGSLKEKVDGYKTAYHILLIAKNEIGYANLRKITSIAWTDYKYYKPRFDLQLLEENSEGIICTSACLGGAISQLFLSDRKDEAIDVAIKLKRIYGSDFYLELTYTGLEEQRLANEFLMTISKELDIPIVITSDSHYVYPWQSDAHMKLVMINTGGKLNKEQKVVNLNDSQKEGSDVDESGMFYQPNQYYVKTYNQLRQEYTNLFGDNPQIAEALENTNRIADMCDFELSFGTEMILPKLYSNPHEILTSKVMSWYKQYTINFSEEDKKTYLDRLTLELDIYDKMDFSMYPLVLEDIIIFAKSKEIMVGCGRGSAAGSLISYALGLTNIDPIPYGLMFSRYLSAGRAKYPLIEFDGFPLSEYL